ncbi:hypothetical protein ACKI16_29315 [Streptomyces scabiei]|uniref:hypothetical protein n=1 Tax=Streptomyces scabiei TaxID=1930 RepID=UPI0038F80A4D
MLPGAQPIADTTTHFVLYDDGSTGQIIVTGEEEPVLGKPGRFTSEEEYRARLGELTAGHAERSAGLLADDEDRTSGDYQALRGAGIPDGTARRLTGWAGPATGPE